MSVKTVVTCDNCGREESFHAHVRVVEITMFTSDELDEGMTDMGIPQPAFHLCGWCAAAMRGALKENQDIANPQVSDES